MTSRRQRSVNIDITATDNASDDLERVGGQSQQTAGRLQGLGATAKLALGTIGVKAAKDFVVELANVSIQAEAVTRRAGVVFGQSADEVEAWSERVHEAFGLSANATLGLAAGIGDLLIPLGFTREQAAQIAPAVAEAGNAFAEFTGQDTTFAIEAVGKALLGEREQLKSLGVVVREEDLRLEGLTGTFLGVEGATDAQAKALNTLNLIMERGGDAITAYEDRAGSLQATQKELTARIEEAKLELAEGLAPAFAFALQAGVDLIDGLELEFNRLAGIFSGAADQQVAFIEGQRSIKDALREGADPAVAFANAVAHVARVGELTQEKVEGLRNAAGLTDEQFMAARFTLLEYAAAETEASITTEELNEALGINAERQAEATAKAQELVGTHEDLAGKMEAARLAEEARRAAMFLTEEQSEELAKKTKDLVAGYEALAEQNRKTAASYRDELTPEIGRHVDLFGEAVEQIERSLQDLEEDWLESEEQQRNYWSNLNTLAAAGLDDLVRELEEKGPEAAGVTAELAADMDAAMAWEERIETQRVMAEAYARSIATGALDGKPSIITTMEQYGIDIAHAIQRGFDAVTLGATFDIAFDSAPGAAVGSGGDPARNGGPVIE